jgi:radical SAM-linked protein
VFRREAETEAAALPQRELATVLDASLAASGLPLVAGERSRRRSALAFGAPLPVRMTVERELADLYLAARCPMHEVRRSVESALPDGFQLVDLYDVWLGEAPLAAQVAAADYRIELAPGHPSVETLAEASRSLIGARTLSRTRQKGEGVVRYDLRPLVEAVEVTDPGPPARLLVRTRFHNELGTGRPEEVLAAVREIAGGSLEAASIVRERVLLLDELHDGGAGRPGG